MFQRFRVLTARHRVHLAELTTVLYVIRPVIVYICIVLQLVQFRGYASWIFIVYFDGIFFPLSARFFGIFLACEISQRVVYSPVLGFESQTRAIILKRRKKKKKNWKVTVQTEFCGLRKTVKTTRHADKYLAGLENSNEVYVLFRIIYVVAHFFHALVESQEQLMVHLSRNENRVTVYAYIRLLFDGTFSNVR